MHRKDRFANGSSDNTFAAANQIKGRKNTAAPDPSPMALRRAGLNAARPIFTSTATLPVRAVPDFTAAKTVVVSCAGAAWTAFAVIAVRMDTEDRSIPRLWK